MGSWSFAVPHVSGEFAHWKGDVALYKAVENQEKCPPAMLPYFLWYCCKLSRIFAGMRIDSGG